MIKSHLYLPVLGAFLLGILAGCSTTTTSTTPRTAVEIALLTEAGESTVSQMGVDGNIFYNRFYIDVDEYDTYEREYMVSALRRRLLQHGMHSVMTPDEADVIVHARSGVLAIDESRTLIGIPEIPLPIPSADGGGSYIATPELALFRRHVQIARSRLSVYGTETVTNGMAFDMGTATSQRFYTRWVFFAFISFRTTDLGPPYRTRTME
ncbi:MAG: hypothetical protein JJU11_06835 [Candidatus Sumerlaeia bacterium]|nr:hypothetical protein [Candidatus Sumerlaeia bacterium]